MKRVLFALPLMAMASSAFAAGLTVTNHSGLPIDELTVSAAGKNAFGANLMDGIKEGALDDGKTVDHRRNWPTAPMTSRSPPRTRACSAPSRT